MKTNWNKLAKNIPTKVKIAAKTSYEVLLIKDFHGEDTYGETRFDPKQIVLRTGMAPKLTTETYFHEILHAISNEYNIGLTETQVLNFEGSLPYLIKIVKQLEGINE